MMNDMMRETLADRHGAQGRTARLARGGQDRHQPGLPRRLVRRLHRDLVTGVWLGNDDGSPTKKVTGGNLPAEIWSRFMRDAHAGVPSAGLPLGDWRGDSAADPAPPPAPVAAGAPMAINPTLRRGEVTTPVPANVGPPPREKNILEKLLGQI